MSLTDRCIMTWEPNKSRWRKMHRGKIYTVTCETLGQPATKEASYRAANQWWEEKKAELEAHQPAHPHRAVLEVIERRMDWAAAHQPDLVPVLEDDLEIVKALPEGDRFAWAFLGEQRQWEVWADRLARHHAPPLPADRTIAAQIERHLGLERARVDAGQISVSEFDTIRRCLHDFRDWIGGSNPVVLLDAEHWEAWWTHLMGQAISVEYKKKKLRYARSLISWLAEKGLVPVPPNLHSRRYRFGGGIRVVPTVPLADLKKLVAGAPGQLRLHLLLMLNCGMYQGDISDLMPSQVDWEAGRIRRKRSKTEDHAKVPIVEYRLWPETRRLLREYGRTEGERALLTESGRPWVRDFLKPDGKRSKVDAIKSNYVHLRRKTKLAYPMKLLRKTSASLLETNADFARYATLFLGHSPRSIADRHYVVPSQENFDLAVAWLGEKYEIESP